MVSSGSHRKLSPSGNRDTCHVLNSSSHSERAPMPRRRRNAPSRMIRIKSASRPAEPLRVVVAFDGGTAVMYGYHAGGLTRSQANGVLYLSPGGSDIAATCRGATINAKSPTTARIAARVRWGHAGPTSQSPPQSGRSFAPASRRLATTPGSARASAPGAGIRRSEGPTQQPAVHVGHAGDLRRHGRISFSNKSRAAYVFVRGSAPIHSLASATSPQCFAPFAKLLDSRMLAQRRARASYVPGGDVTRWNR